MAENVADEIDQQYLDENFVFNKLLSFIGTNDADSNILCPFFH